MCFGEPRSTLHRDNATVSLSQRPMHALRLRVTRAQQFSEEARDEHALLLRLVRSESRVCMLCYGMMAICGFSGDDLRLVLRHDGRFSGAVRLSF